MRDRFFHHGAQAALVDVAHGERAHAGSRARAAAPACPRRAVPTSATLRGIHLGREAEQTWSAPPGPRRRSRPAACRARCRWGSICGVFMSACASIQSRPMRFCFVRGSAATRRPPCRWRSNDRRPAPAAPCRRPAPAPPCAASRSQVAAICGRYLAWRGPCRQTFRLLHRHVAQIRDVVAERRQRAYSGWPRAAPTAPCRRRGGPAPRSSGAPMMAM